MSVSAVIRSIFTSAPTVLPTTIEAVSDFTRGPSSLNVTIGELAVFHCQHPDAFRVDWRLNGTLLEVSNFPPTISANSRSLPDGSGYLHSLTIRALTTNNNTIFDCVLPGFQTVSTSALLRIQGRNLGVECMYCNTVSVIYYTIGPLDAPANVRSSRNYNSKTTTIIWSPPFSLDLTSSDIDVIYCLEVYNITCGEGALIISDCNVTEHTYHTSFLYPRYIYYITVTPRSNVEGALNGTATHTEGI